MKLSTPVIIKGALALIMVLCLFDMPYGFYEFTRFAAFAGFGYLAYKRYDKESKDLSILYIILAVLFQPFFKLALGREIWNVVDVLVAIFLAYRVYANIKNKKDTTYGNNVSRVMFCIEKSQHTPEKGSVTITGVEVFSSENAK